MRSHARLWLLGLLLPLCLAAVPAQAQYLYLDSNGDGIRDAQDRLNPDGPTTIDVWLVTDRDRDGTPVVCDVESGTGMTLNSYSFVLHAVGGTMEWGTMQNRLPFTGPGACFASDQDTTDPVYYHNGWGYRDILPPGRYRLATLTVRPASGHPSIFVEPYHPVLRTRITAFGTMCPALENDNTYKLGDDWRDASGIGTPQAEAGGPYYATTGDAVPFHGDGSRDPDGQAITYLWDFGDGAAATGDRPTHAYAAAGHYTAVLTVTGAGGSGSDHADVVVSDPHQPVARAGGPYRGRAGTPVHFDGRGSYDPDGSALRFDWRFGDGLSATGMTLDHVYSVAGAYVAQLTVSDGVYSDVDAADVTIESASTTAPVAIPGGPYAGVAGQDILFDGSRSYDADGHEIGYAWRFGDGTAGTGAQVRHKYGAGGVYTVTLTVSDGSLAGSETTEATIAAGVAARAFTEERVPTVTVGPDEQPLTVSIEPLNGAFGVDDMDPWPITMRSIGTGSVTEISAQDLVLTDRDEDGNGVTELTVTFAAEDLARLFDGVEHPSHVDVTLSGRLYQGGVFLADLAMNVRPGSGGRLKISPNPFNPQTIITFHLTRPGPVRANLFDVQGRMVRTVLDAARMDSGSHQVPLDAIGARGETLASGIYFLRLDGPDGVITKRLAVAK
ncbi:MAG TPA: PKD domain-containing protein [Candidatus Eisenbacteria bacterium]